MNIGKSNNKEKDIQGYKIELSVLLGSGKFGKVYRGYRTNDNKMVAVKAISINSIQDKKLLKSIDFECTTLLKLKSKFIVKVYDIRVFILFTYRDQKIEFIL
jgi:serine/threonine protein kinase